MKHPFFKSILVLGAALALMNCSDENTAAPSNDEYVTPEACWVLNADQTMLIYATGVVTDAKGNPIGVLNETQTAIVSLDGTQFIVNNVNLSTLTVIQAGETVPESNVILPASSASVVTPTSSTTPVVTPTSSATTIVPKSSAGTTVKPTSSQQATSSAGTNYTTSSATVTTASSNSQQQQQGGTYTDGTCYDKASGKNVKPYENLNSNGMSYAYKEDCSVNCYYDPANNNCASLGSGTTTAKSSSSSQQQQQWQQSSSSQAKSSSSQQQTSTTGSTGTGNFQGAYVINSSYTVKATGGKSGSGWATRYWDCCKPHCAWPDKGGLKAHACDASGNKISDDGATSMCNGGNAGTCKSQIPMIVSDKLAFAYAAVPGSAGGECGKCFALEFTGTGKYETKANHQAMKGKTLVVIASNIGYDVAEGQFDIMIPGGGYGAFNGCANKMGWGDQGAQYGGLLSKCEDEVGYDGDLLTKRKQCLAKKCEASFSTDPVAKQGCMFLATWYEAAGNPNHNFKEVECPQELINNF